MKIWKNQILLFIYSLFLVLSSSCSTDNDEEPIVDNLRLSTSQITFLSNEDYEVVYVENGGPISSAIPSDSWIDTNINGSSSITISVMSNTSSSTRRGSVEVRNTYGKTATVIIIQKGMTTSGGGEDNPPEDTKLKAPTNVKAVKSGNTIIVTWDAVEGASRYEVYHSSSADGKYSSYGYWTNNRYVDEGIVVEENYYKIKAIGSTVSDFSEYAYCYYQLSGGSKKPAVPTGLSARQDGESIIVSWNSVSNVYYYRLWYSTPSGQEDFTNVYAPTTTAVFDRNMKDGTYRFWIQSVNSDYEASDSSSKISCTFKSSGGGGNTPSKLETPKNIEAYSSTYYVQVSCDEVPLAYQYELYRSTSPNSGYSKISASGGSTAGGRYVLTDSNPKSGTTYYKIKAVALSYLGIADSDLSAYVKVVR